MYIKDYIIYYAPSGEFVSSYKDVFDTTEFPEEYSLFGSITDAQKTIDYIAEKFGMSKNLFDIEEL